DSAFGAGWVERGKCDRGWRSQVAGVRSDIVVTLSFCGNRKALYVVGWCRRGRVFYHSKPRHRPAHRAEIAGGTESTAVGIGTAGEWARDSVSVWIIPVSRGYAVRVLSDAIRDFRQGRQ